MRQLNRIQRAILILILAIDGLLCLFPPSLNYANRYEGHRWFLDGFNSYGVDVRVSFGQLSAEVMIVAIIGATACVLAGTLADERIAALISTVRALISTVRALARAMLPIGGVVLALVFLALVPLVLLAGLVAEPSSALAPLGTQVRHQLIAYRAPAYRAWKECTPRVPVANCLLPFGRFFLKAVGYVYEHAISNPATVCRNIGELPILEPAAAAQRDGAAFVLLQGFLKSLTENFRRDARVAGCCKVVAKRSQSLCHIRQGVIRTRRRLASPGSTRTSSHSTSSSYNLIGLRGSPSAPLPVRYARTHSHEWPCARSM